MIKLDRLGWAVEGTFKLGDTRVGIRTTSEPVGRWIAEVLAGHRMTRWQDPYYSLVVAEQGGSGRRGYHVLYRGVVPVVRTADLATLARAFLEEIESHTFGRRRDLIYLDASLIDGPRGTCLIPSSFTPALGVQSRRAERLGLMLPATTWVAIDPDTARAVPCVSTLGVPEDAVGRLVGTRAAGPFDRAFVDRPTRIDAACLVHDQPEGPPVPVSRASTLYRFAGMSVNLPRIGGRRTLEGLGRLVASARCFGIAPMRTGQVLEAMAEVTGGGRNATPSDVRKIRAPMDGRADGAP